jgi:hypothetical protein
MHTLQEIVWQQRALKDVKDLFDLAGLVLSRVPPTKRAQVEFPKLSALMLVLHMPPSHC